VRGDFLLFLGFWTIAAIAAIGGVVAVLNRWKQRLELERQRLGILEKALQHPNVDDATRAELLRTLTAQRPPSHPVAGSAANHLVSWWPKLWFGSAWLLFVVGGCLLASEALDLTNIRDTHTLLIMMVSGFAMMTLPSALREITRRSGATAER